MSPPPLEAALEAWLAVLDQLDHYELLGLARDASSEDVQSAFHDFSERFHPDRHRGQAPQEREAILRIFRRGSEAYRVLRQPASRSDYDLRLATSGSRPSSGPADDSELQALDELCLTPGGRLHARQAVRAISSGDLAGASELLERALLAEGANRRLEERLIALRELLDLSRPEGPSAPQ